MDIVNPEKNQATDHTFEFGHWIPCYHAIPVGQVQSDGSADLLEDRSFTVFTMPQPFDWYVFGFASDWSQSFLLDTIIHVAYMGEKENVSTRFLPASALLGRPNQYNPGWLPLQCGYDEGPKIHKAWAWGALETEQSEYGIGIWYDSKARNFIAPFRVPQGEQLRFIVGNRCDEDFEDTTLTVVGMRWMPWDQGGIL